MRSFKGHIKIPSELPSVIIALSYVTSHNHDFDKCHLNLDALDRLLKPTLKS